ncbi:hypothetical protein GWK47_035252 [Chionoecetes opilio]|uniref:Uncharacterized protein n=1 Tax=Chionoecetes opilio TaxID=41210 RepID=A0A8J4YH20_CHIOP|nr:hypothetical protein GWK47_035252 [Chionoecetes opilio]
MSTQHASALCPSVTGGTGDHYYSSRLEDYLLTEPSLGLVHPNEASASAGALLGRRIVTLSEARRATYVQVASKLRAWSQTSAPRIFDGVLCGKVSFPNFASLRSAWCPSLERI